MNIELKIIDKEFYPDNGFGSLPSYATLGSCAVDLYATRDYVIAPQERIKIPTGIAIHIGTNDTPREEQNEICNWLSTVDTEVRMMGMIVPRSGLGTKGLILANSVGVIDEDYQGEIIISAWNSLPMGWADIYLDDSEKEGRNIKIKAGDRIAQMCIVPVIVANWVVVDEFSQQTSRGEGAFGSSGK